MAVAVDYIYLAAPLPWYTIDIFSSDRHCSQGHQSERHKSAPAMNHWEYEPPTSGDCAVCGTVTTKRCSKCIEGLDPDLNKLATTFYCKKECQVADFDRHKTACRNANARVQLYHGAWLLHQIFYKCRLFALDVDIASVKVENGKVLVKEKPEKTYVRGHFELYDLHDFFLPPSEDGAAILALGMSQDVLLYTDGLLAKVTEGICELEDLSDCVCHISKDRLRVTGKTSDLHYKDKECQHYFMRIRLGDEKMYVLDLTGAHFGQYHPLCVQEPYLYHNAINGQATVCEYGTLYHNFKGAMLEHHEQPPHRRKLHYPTIVQTRYIFEMATRIVTAWEERNKTTLAKMLRLPKNGPGGCKETCMALLAEVDDGLVEYLEWWKSDQGPQIKNDKEGKMVFKHGEYHGPKGVKVDGADAASMRLFAACRPKHRAQK